jgi:hypothetical protein
MQLCVYAGRFVRRARHVFTNFEEPLSDVELKAKHVDEALLPHPPLSGSEVLVRACVTDVVRRYLNLDVNPTQHTSVRPSKAYSCVGAPDLCCHTATLQRVT